MTELDLTFGPAGEEWHYSKSTKTYDLSRGLSTKLIVPTTEGPEGTSVKIAPEISALVIVDMQNFFLDSQCMDHPMGLKAVEPTIRVVEKCREIGIQVIWLNWGLTDEDLAFMPAGVQRGFLKDTIQAKASTRPRYNGLGSDLGSGKGRCLFAGSWNADIYPPLKDHVLPSDIHCAKNRMSGMWNNEQPLWKCLDKEKKRTLLFTGVNTDQCVLGTFVDSYNAGWDCVIVDDCCGTTTNGGKDVSLYNIAGSYGFVTDSRSLVATKLVK